MGTILIVDDDPDILVVVEAVLRAAGHRVLPFSDPKVVAEAVQGTRVDAMVLDVMMPGLSGLDLLGALREERSTEDLPVLFLSALDSPPDRIRGLKKGADDYLGKPFEPEELVLRVEHLIGRSQRPAAPAPSPPEPAPDDQPAAELSGEDGERAVGRYQILGTLGEGSMGTVYRGWDPKLQRMVALKTVRPELEFTSVSQDELVSRLLHEAVMVARFNHPNIVAVFDVSDSPKTPFIAMEFVDGPSLETHLADRSLLSPAESVSLALQIARALSAAHAGEVVHHDVKPGNILLGRDGRAKVTDFGLARWIHTVSRESGHIFGTPGFLAPEVLLGEAYDKVSDLFALGAILYRCLTGEWAFAGATVREVLSSTLKGVDVPPSCFNPQIPDSLERLVLGLLEVERSHRISTAEEVVVRLERFASLGLPATTPRTLAGIRAPKTSPSGTVDGHSKVLESAWAKDRRGEG